MFPRAISVAPEPPVSHGTLPTGIGSVVSTVDSQTVGPAVSIVALNVVAPIVSPCGAPGPWRDIQHSHWSRYDIAALSLVENSRVLIYLMH